MDTLILLQGGHTTLLKGVAPREIACGIEAAREHKMPYVFVEGGVGSPGQDRVCLDPASVVGFIAVGKEKQPVRVGPVVHSHDDTAVVA